MNKQLTSAELKRLNERFGRKKSFTKITSQAESTKHILDDKLKCELEKSKHRKNKNSLENITAKLIRNAKAQNFLHEWQAILKSEQEILLYQLTEFIHKSY